MGNGITRKGYLLFLFIGFVLVAGYAAAEDNEREKLLERQKELNQRIETLKREQNFLLFEKSAYASDSKYLILNIAAKTGQLKYKNRLLKEFSFLPASRQIGKLKEGPVELTAKVEGSRNRSELIFDKAIMFRIKGNGVAPDKKSPLAYLPKKDFISIFFAIETGAKAYILP